MNEVQKIILTCLLGPEDPTAFSRFRQQAKEKERYWKDPEKGRKKSREKQRKRKAKNPEKFAALERARYLADIEGAKARQQKQYWKDPESKREEANARRRENPEEARRKERERIKKNPEPSKRANRKWKRANRQAIRNQDNYRYVNNIQHKLGKNLRSRLGSALRRACAGKSANTMELLGCPWVWAEVHLESLFKPGMTWKNHGPVWHIDHIKPIASFDLTDPEQQKMCFHWTNLQPLFAAENLSKGAKYV